jgi:hypothetical protein
MADEGACALQRPTAAGAGAVACWPFLKWIAHAQVEPPPCHPVAFSHPTHAQRRAPINACLHAATVRKRLVTQEVVTAALTVKRVAAAYFAFVAALETGTPDDA